MSSRPAELETRTREGRVEAERADEYVEFWRAGTVARGLFACTACGRSGVSVHRIPSCPTCAGRLWEELSSSPFGGQSEALLAAQVSAYETWQDEDLDGMAGLVQSAFLALAIGPVLWLLLAALAYGLFMGMHG